MTFAGKLLQTGSKIIFQFVHAHCNYPLNDDVDAAAGRAAQLPQQDMAQVHLHDFLSATQRHLRAKWIETIPDDNHRVQVCGRGTVNLSALRSLSREDQTEFLRLRSGFTKLLGPFVRILNKQVPAQCRWCCPVEASELVPVLIPTRHEAHMVLYVCTDCHPPRSFGTRSGLVRHRRGMHDLATDLDGRAVCECDRTFEDDASRRVHRTHCKVWKKLHRPQMPTADPVDPTEEEDVQPPAPPPSPRVQLPDETLSHVLLHCPALDELRHTEPHRSYFDRNSDEIGPVLRKLTSDHHLVQFVREAVLILIKRQEAAENSTVP